MIGSVLGVFSELGSNQVVSRGLNPIWCNRPDWSLPAWAPWKQEKQLVCACCPVLWLY